MMTFNTVEFKLIFFFFPLDEAIDVCLTDSPLYYESVQGYKL